MTKKKNVDFFSKYEEFAWGHNPCTIEINAQYALKNGVSTKGLSLFRLYNLWAEDPEMVILYNDIDNLNLTSDMKKFARNTLYNSLKCFPTKPFEVFVYGEGVGTRIYRFSREGQDFFIEVKIGTLTPQLNSGFMVFESGLKSCGVSKGIIDIYKKGLIERGFVDSCDDPFYKSIGREYLDYRESQ